MHAVMYRFERWNFVWNHWFREPRPVPGDVRLDTCRRCKRGIWASQVVRWTRAARFCYPRSGMCQECQGYRPGELGAEHGTD